MKSYLLTLLVGNNHDGKVRLEKKPNKEDFIRNLNLFIEMNFGIIALAAVLILLIIFVWVCFTIVGLSAVDSGVTYNQLENII